MANSGSIPAPIIRPAATADAPAITRLLRESIGELCGADHGHREAPLEAWLANKTVANVTAWTRDSANIMLVAMIGPEIAGVGCLRTDGHLVLNYVAPGHRFRGVSKAIVAALEHHARDLAVGAIELDSTRTALDFYRAAGFVGAGPPATKHGLTAYPLVKTLTPASDARPA